MTPALAIALDLFLTRLIDQVEDVLVRPDKPKLCASESPDSEETYQKTA